MSHADRGRLLVLATLISVSPVIASAQSRDSTQRRDSSQVRQRQTQRDSASGTLVARPTLSQLMTAISTLDSGTVRFTSATNLTADSIVLVDITPIVTATDTAALTTALTQNEKQITALRTALQEHVALQGLLTAQKVQNAQIVAVDVAPGGQRAW